jgi:hypothetical protein
VGTELPLVVSERANLRPWTPHDPAVFSDPYEQVTGAGDERFGKRLLEESELAASLDHPPSLNTVYEDFDALAVGEGESRELPLVERRRLHRRGADTRRGIEIHLYADTHVMPV